MTGLYVPESHPCLLAHLTLVGTTQEQAEETQTPQPTPMDVLLATDPGTGPSGPEGKAWD